MSSRRSSGSNRVESGVEPTRSQNITVSWRRSASLEAAAVTAEVGSEALRVAMASSSLRRWPTEVTPMLIRVFGGELRQHLGVDIIVAEHRYIALKSQIPQPGRYVHAVILASEER